jgi:tape measure domain-containing protein
MKIYEYIIRMKDEATDKLRSLARSGSSVRDTFRNLGSSVSTFGRQLGRLGSDFANLIGLNTVLIRTLGPAALAASFAFLGGRAVSLAGDLEQTKVGFEVMLGSAEKANAMVANIRKMAKFTPFESTDLFKASEILLGFGVAGEQIMPTLNMLGDVARGNSEKLRLISLAYAQIQSAGRLMGQDLLQLVNAGFNPLQEISRKTGRSMRQLKQDMEDGNISAQMVTDAFKSATSEGGRFFGMMAKQSQTFQGMVSTLRDEWNESLTMLGEKILPAAIRGVVWLRSVLQDLTTRIDFTPILTALSDTWAALKSLGNIFVELFNAMGVTVTQAGAMQFAFNALALSLRIGFFPLRALILGVKTWIEIASTAISVTKGFAQILEGLRTGNFTLAKSGFDTAKNGLLEGFDNVKSNVSDFVKNEKEGFGQIFTTGTKPDQGAAAAEKWGFPGSSKSGAADGKVKDGIDKITGGGRQAVNVTINLENLVGTQNFNVTNVKETINDMKKQVIEALLQTVNSANVAASQ